MPSVPRNLTGSVTDGTLSLTWQPSTDDEAVQGYNVYRDNQYFATVSEPNFTDVDNRDVAHSWYVVAFDIRTNFSARSERIVLPDPGPVDTTLPPSVPTALVGFVEPGSAFDTVHLTWQAATDDQAVAGYNIYQNRQYVATRIATSFEANVDAGSSNVFELVAFDFDGNFSTSSESLTLPLGTAQVDPGIPPSVPSGLAGNTTTANGQTQVELSWEPSTSEVSVSGYNIYRNNNYLRTVFQTQFSDTVTAGAAVAYSVAAFDDFGNFSSRSAPLSLLGGANQPPFFSGLTDQNLQLGQRWDLLLRPVDPDGGSAGILVENLPVGAELIDNLDGSRTLTWTPESGDVGVYTIVIVAFDLADSALRTSESITLNVGNSEPPAESSFSIAIAQAAYSLVEGSPDRLTIPIAVDRTTASSAPISLTVEATNAIDAIGIHASFSQDVLPFGQTQTELNLSLDVGVLPILAQQRSFTVTASDGNETQIASVTVAVTPVARDDVYLLMGQSNMAGFSEDGAKQAGPGQPDEPNLRIRQANVAANDEALFSSAAAYSDIAVNFLTPMIVTAEDPLHQPVDPDTLSKEGTQIGLGLSFAKTALPHTSRNIVLVPAAWPGTGFCDASGKPAHWNSDMTAFTPSDDPILGDTLLLDRALARVNQTLLETGGILRGIIWHQGEEDSRPRCASLYPANLKSMVEALRSTIIEDARGSDARGPVANIPFVVGTLSRGRDDRGDFSGFDEAKSLVDSVLRNVANTVPFSEVVLTDDLIPANGYPCGEGSCIHFGAAALREMGARAHRALVRAAGD